METMSSLPGYYYRSSC